MIARIICCQFGLDRRWWRRTAVTFHAILDRPDARVLDICCGTGDLTGALLAKRPVNAEPVTGLDFSPMLRLAERKYAGANVRWVEGDAMALPFPGQLLRSCDLCLFGFRNLSNYAAGLREIHRVLRPGGSIGILECNQPDGVSGALYNLYFRHVLPVAGGWISGSARRTNGYPHRFSAFRAHRA